jgi:hypothetical protein
MKQEPVAWAIKSDSDFTEIGFDNDLLEEVEEMYAMEGWKYEVVPLYTAPRELSDEEIMEIFTAYEQMQEYGYVGKKPFKVSLGWSLSERNDCLMLARAILKKASEK